MKTMNALFVMALLIFGSSCTNYNPLDRNGSSKELETYYLEMDYYQVSLEAEDRQLRNEMLHIMEGMEDGKTEEKGRYEEIQKRRSIIAENLDWNGGIQGRRPIIGGGVPPPRCDVPDPTLRPCPVMLPVLDNFYLAAEQWEQSGDRGAIEGFDEKGNLVAEMKGMSEVPESDGFFLKAEIDYYADKERIHEIRITNIDAREETRTSIFRVVE